MKTGFASHERGATMIEVFGVLAILSIISVGALLGYSKIMDKFSSAKGVTEVKKILKDVHSYCSFERPCTITTEKAYKLGILTDEYYDSVTKKTFSPFDKSSGFKFDYGTGLSGCDGCAYYTFQHEALPVPQCVELMTADWKDDVYMRLYQFDIESRNYLFNERKNFSCDEASGCYFFPMDLGDAVSLCNNIWNNREEGSYVYKWYFI